MSEDVPANTVLINTVPVNTVPVNTVQIGFDIAELQVINLNPGDILSAKLIGDNYDVDTMNSLREHLKRVFPNNEVMVFAMPSGDDIQFQAIKPEEPKKYCNDCDCGKQERSGD